MGVRWRLVIRFIAATEELELSFYLKHISCHICINLDKPHAMPMATTSYRVHIAWYSLTSISFCETILEYITFYELKHILEIFVANWPRDRQSERETTTRMRHDRSGKAHGLGKVRSPPGRISITKQTVLEEPADTQCVRRIRYSCYMYLYR